MPRTVTYRCDQCKSTESMEFDASTTELECSHCRGRLTTNRDAVRAGALTACLVCPCNEVFLRKDFPQRLGVAIVVVGLGLSCVTWMYHMLAATYAIMFATALIDVALFVFIGDVIECYRCHAQYRGIDKAESVRAFDLEVHERHRQLEARKAQMQRTAK